MKLSHFGKIITNMVTGPIYSRRCHQIASHYDINGYERIYFVHIRKTGGTSLNHSFFNLSVDDSASFYLHLAKKADHRIICKDKIYVGWNAEYINGGDYFYAFSHTPLHALNLPEKTFTITCFRDPVKRVISHYNMLMEFYVNKIDHPCMLVEGKWLGNTFDDFLKRIPKEHLCNQLYMFSPKYDINMAVEMVAGLSHIFFVESFSKGIDVLSKKTRLNLKDQHIRKAKYSNQIQNKSIENLREMLDEEYLFLDRVQEFQNG